MSERIGLCFRCEHRARFFETGHGPRCECQAKNQAVGSCYMYRPVRPVVLAPNDGERRPILAGWAFAGRAHAVRIFNGIAEAVGVKGGITVLYRKREGRKS
jgi:hypothetical protein